MSIVGDAETVIAPWSVVPRWIGAHIVPILISVLIVAAGVWFALHELRGTAVATTKATLATGQAGAAMQSASDTVRTIQNDTNHTTTITNWVHDAQSAVNAAPDAAAADAAGRDGLCHLAADLCPTPSVQQPHP